MTERTYTITVSGALTVFDTRYSDRAVNIGAEYSGLPRPQQLRAAAQALLDQRQPLARLDWSGADLHGLDLSGVDAHQACFAQANLQRADFSRADIHEADFTEADARHAKFVGALGNSAKFAKADLGYATLAKAQLSYADFPEAVFFQTGVTNTVLYAADLATADLNWVNFEHADIYEAAFGPEVPRVPHIHQAILKATSKPGALEMGAWHTCETTHCRAGWAVALAGDAGRALEERVGPATAGALIYMASDPTLRRVPEFYTSNREALADIKAEAAREAVLDPMPEPAPATNQQETQK